MITYEKCKNSELETVKYEYEENGKTIKKYIHSKYDPVKEAKEWANKVYDKDKKIYVIYGGGLLYHIYELNELINKSKKDPDYGIIVIEPIEELYEKNKDNPFFNNSHLLYSKAMEDKNDVISFFKINIGYYYYKTTEILEYDAYSNILRNYVDTIYEAYKIYYSYALVNFNTVSSKSVLTLENMIKNYAFYRKSAGINSFKNIFEGKTAVIVSAGPSLDKNIKDLYGNNDVIIITGGRSMRALINNDIKPHIVCSMEMSDASYHNIYEKYDLFNEKVPMVTDFNANYRINREYKGEKIFQQDVWDIAMKDIFERDIDNLKVAGSVAVLQIQLAIYMGCKNIIMIGQDLAHKEDGSYYSEQTKNDGNNKNTIKENETLYVKGNYVEKIRTDFALDNFRIIIQEIIADNPDVKFINATEGGAFIKGSHIMTLKEALSKVDKQEIDYESAINKMIESGKEDISEEYIDKKLNNLKEDMQYIKKISRQALSSAMKLRSYSTPNNNSILKKLDDADKKMKTKKAANAMIHSFLHFFKLEIANVADDDYKNLAKITKRQYKDTLDIANECIKFIDEELEYRNKK